LMISALPPSSIQSTLSLSRTLKIFHSEWSPKKVKEEAIPSAIDCNEKVSTGLPTHYDSDDETMTDEDDSSRR
jgi:hypothetical protein